MKYLFFIFFFLLWADIAFYTNALWVMALFMVGFSAVFWNTYCKEYKPFSGVVLLPSKLILAISFWGCVGFCLFSYQETITCLGCMQAYLGRTLTATFDNSIWAHSKQFIRFEIMLALAVLWAIAFIFLTRKGNKKC